MASLFFPLITLPVLFYIFLNSSSAFMDQDSDSSSDPDTEMAECGPRLLPLASCASFVQGSAPSPAQSCCANLVQLYGLQPSCLCMLLHKSPSTSVNVNRTLAARLPGLCNLEPNVSDCPGLVLTPGSPESQIFHEIKKNTSSLTVSPSGTTPQASMGVGLGRSGGTKLKYEGVQLYAQTIVASLFMEFLHHIH